MGHVEHSTIYLSQIVRHRTCIQEMGHVEHSTIYLSQIVRHRTCIQEMGHVEHSTIYLRFSIWTGSIFQEYSCNFNLIVFRRDMQRSVSILVKNAQNKN